MGWAYALAGRKDEALRVLDSLKERALRETVDPLAFAYLYAALGEKDTAFEWLRKATAEPSVDLLWLKVVPN